jgi:hypothetical protein
LYSFVEEEERIEKTFEEVAQNAVQIIIESTTYDKSDGFIYIELCKKIYKKNKFYIRFN